MTAPPQLPEPLEPQPRRSMGTWVTLLIVWSVGLLMWMIYLAMGIYLLYWIM